MNEVDPIRRASAGVVAGVLLAVLGASVLLPPGWDAGFTICMLRGLTEIPCPLCGMTHAFIWLAHGHLAEAVAANALSPVVFAGVVWAAGRSLAIALGLSSPAWPAIPRAVGVAIVGVVLAWWGLRLYLGV